MGKKHLNNNNNISSPISLSRGIRQGCPLSILYYIIQWVVTTKNVNQEKYKTKQKNTKDIKILQYVDDSNFYLKLGSHRDDEPY